MNKRTSLLNILAAEIPDADRRLYRKTDDVAARIISLMKQRGISQRELATKLGKSESYVSRVLGGGVNLTIKTIAQFEAALGADILIVPQAPSRELLPYQSRKEVVNIVTRHVVEGLHVDDGGDLVYETSQTLMTIYSGKDQPSSLSRSKDVMAASDEIVCAG